MSYCVPSFVTKGEYEVIRVTVLVEIYMGHPKSIRTDFVKNAN